MIKRILLAGTLAVGLALTLGPSSSAQVFGQNQNITVVDSGTACVTAPTACATFALDSVSGGITISISGTWTGTLTFEGTNNDGVWTAIGVTNLATGARVTTTTASGLFGIGNSGFIKVRVRATAAVTGSALVTAAKGLGQPSADFFSGGPLSASTGTFTGSVTAGGQFLAVPGTAAAPSYAFTANPGTGFYNFGGTPGRIGWTNGAGTLTGIIDVNGIAMTTTSPTLILNDLTLSRSGAGTLGMTAVLFANLGTPVNGSLAYCSDCLIQAVCAGAGTGAFAKRLGGVWVCN